MSTVVFGTSAIIDLLNALIALKMSSVTLRFQKKR